MTNKMTIEMTNYSDEAALVEGVAEILHAKLKRALDERAAASLALSGGSTPMPIYSRLAGMELDWSKVTGLPSDERWVATDHQASNYRQIVERFADCDLVIESLVPTDADGEPDPQVGIRTLARLPSALDVALLGMGADGHFASLFPHSPTLAAGLDPDSHEQVLAVVPDPLPPEAPHARITLTLSKLLAARHLMLVITGQDKYEMLERASRPDADPNELPVAALLQAAGERLDIHWSPRT